MGLAYPVTRAREVAVSVTPTAAGISIAKPTEEAWFKELDEAVKELQQGSVGTSVVTKTAADSPYTVAATDRVVILDATAGAVVANLPAVSAGRVLSFKRKDSSANAVTVQRAGSATIDGATSFTLSALAAADVVSDGTNWHHYS